MKSRTTAVFRTRLERLPEDVRRQARKAYKLFHMNPWHSSLSFKKIHPEKPLYSVRIAKGYRAVGKRDEQGMLWFWVGTHAEYDELIKWR